MTKRQQTTTKRRTSFDDLTDDLTLDIFSRLPIKALVKLMVVSKEWHRLITANRLFIKQTTILLRREDDDKNRNLPCYDSTELLGFSSGLPFDLSWALFLDYCNGLVLLWHDATYLKKEHSFSKYYVVLNRITKQFVTVDKPSPGSIDKVYAALAYDPYQSKQFRIVRFENHKQYLKVFFSEIWSWVTLSFVLEDVIIKAAWVRQCIYFKEAIYRLSPSGHLLRFMLEIESKTVSGCAHAIGLPLDTNTGDDKSCIGISNGRINFAIFDGPKISIWVLAHDFNCVDNSYQWCLNYVILNPFRRTFNLNFDPDFQPIAFHPHSDILFVKIHIFPDNLITCGYHLSEHKLCELKTQKLLGLNTWRRFFFLDLQCGLRFARCKANDSNDVGIQREDNKETDLLVPNNGDQLA